MTESIQKWLLVCDAAVKGPADIPRLARDLAQTTCHDRAEPGAHAAVSMMIRHSTTSAHLLSALAAADTLLPRPILHWTDWRRVCEAVVHKDPAPSRAVLTLALNVLLAGGEVAALQMATTAHMDATLLLLATDDNNAALQDLAKGAFAAVCLATKDIERTTLPKCLMDRLPEPFVPAKGRFPASTTCIVCLKSAPTHGGGPPWRALPCACVLHAHCFAQWSTKGNAHFWTHTQCLVCRHSIADTTLATLAR